MSKKENYIKYLASLSGICFLACMLIKFVDYQKALLQNNTTTYLIISLILLFIGIGLISLYWTIKLLDYKKTDYKFNKKEKLYMLGSFSLYILTILMVIIYIILAALNVNVLVTFIVFIVITLIFIISASIFEMLSRIGYQAYLYKKEYIEYETIRKEKIKKITQENKEISLQDANKLVDNKKRTNEAEKLLKKDIVKNKEKEKNPFKD